jgi:subtilisin family serine protease
MNTKFIFTYFGIIILVYIISIGGKENSSTENLSVSYIEKNGLYSWPVVNMNARGIVPFSDSNLPIIGVIDSGIDLNNKYISAKNVKQITLDSESIHSQKNHGTMVAGLIIANGDGANLPGGILPGANLVSIQSGTDAGMTIAQLVKAIDLVVENGAEVINISNGTSESSPELERTIKMQLYTE